MTIVGRFESLEFARLRTRHFEMLIKSTYRLILQRLPEELALTNWLLKLESSSDLDELVHELKASEEASLISERFVVPSRTAQSPFPGPNKYIDLAELSSQAKSLAILLKMNCLSKVPQ